MINVEVKGVADIGKIIGTGAQQVVLPPNSTLRTLLEIMSERFGDGFAQKVFMQGTTELSTGVRLLINGRDIAFLHGMDTILKDGDRVSFIPPLAGG